jgi:hypothetical protein
MNANVNSETWVSYSSTNSKHTGVLMRIQNSTANAILWIPCFYYTAYSGWNEYASLTVNGTPNWFDVNGDGVATTACPVLTIPPDRTSTVIAVVGSSPPFSVDSVLTMRATALIFYNNSLRLPAGLTYVDDLDTLPAGSSAWTQ